MAKQPRQPSEIEHRNITRRRWSKWSFWSLPLLMGATFVLGLTSKDMADRVMQLWPIWASWISTATIIVLAYFGMGHKENIAVLEHSSPQPATTRTSATTTSKSVTTATQATPPPDAGEADADEVAQTAIARV